MCRGKREDERLVLSNPISVLNAFFSQLPYHNKKQKPISKYIFRVHIVHINPGSDQTGAGGGGGQGGHAKTKNMDVFEEHLLISK